MRLQLQQSVLLGALLFTIITDGVPGVRMLDSAYNTQVSGQLKDKAALINSLTVVRTNK